MNTFCPDELEECDLVPCTECNKLIHPSLLNGDLNCEGCECHSDERTTPDA